MPHPATTPVLGLTLARRRSFSPPTWASIRWSQWMVDGTATLGSPLLMNCSIAIWAVASCMATRSGRRRRYVFPRSISWLAGSSKCPYTIFSERVRGRFNLWAEGRQPGSSFATRLPQLLLLHAYSSEQAQENLCTGSQDPLGQGQINAVPVASPGHREVFTVLI